MSDGTISENTASGGAGVAISNYYTTPGTFNMTGGKIIKNSASNLGRWCIRL